MTPADRRRAWLMLAVAAFGLLADLHQLWVMRRRERQFAAEILAGREGRLGSYLRGQPAPGSPAAGSAEGPTGDAEADLAALRAELAGESPSVGLGQLGGVHNPVQSAGRTGDAEADLAAFRAAQAGEE